MSQELLTNSHKVGTLDKHPCIYISNPLKLYIHETAETPFDVADEDVDARLDGVDEELGVRVRQATG